MDKWYGLTIEDIRAIEEQTKEELDKVSGKSKEQYSLFTEVNIKGSGPEWYISSMWYSQDIPYWLGTLDNSRVSDQNGVSLLYIMLEIHHSGWEPLMYDWNEVK